MVKNKIFKNWKKQGCAVFLVFSLSILRAEIEDTIEEKLKKETPKNQNSKQYNPDRFKNVCLTLVQKSTHKTTQLTFTQKEPEKNVEGLRIVCKGAYVEDITPQLKGYWAFIEIYKYDKQINQENHIFSNWINSITPSFNDPDWIIKLESSEEEYK